MVHPNENGLLIHLYYYLITETIKIVFTWKSTYKMYVHWNNQIVLYYSVKQSFPFETSDITNNSWRRVWRYQRGNQNPCIEEEQTTQWQKEKVQKDKQRSTKHTYKTKDRVTRTPLTTGGELRCSGRVSSSCSTRGTRRVNVVTNPVISGECKWLYQYFLKIKDKEISGSYSANNCVRVCFYKTIFAFTVCDKFQLRKLWRCHHDLVNQYGIYICFTDNLGY